MANPPALKPTPVRPVPPAINSPEYQPPEVPAPKGPSKVRQGFGVAVSWLLAIMLSTIILQIALGAAIAVGGDYDYLDAHGMLAGILHLLPILIVVSGIVAKDWPATGTGAAVLLLVFIQFPLIELAGSMRALHVLNALMIFTITLLTMHERMPWVKRVKPAKTAKA